MRRVRRRLTNYTRGSPSNGYRRAHRWVVRHPQTFTFHNSLLGRPSLGAGVRYTGVLYGDNANACPIN